MVRASVVIPAHNEERGIGRTLEALYDGMAPDEFEVVVVCNGCTDRTADVVRAAFPQVRVLELETPGKAGAVAAGNAVASTFPRLHLDADVRLPGRAIGTLIAALEADQRLLAVAPERDLDRTGCSRVVSWYYDVWEQLPQVRTGLFGRGAFVLSAAGQSRVDGLPSVMSDDLVVSDAFAPEERAVVAHARSEVVAARRVRDLVNRRVRIVTGGAQAAAAGVRRDDSVTRVSTLLAVCAREPRLFLRLPVFLGVTIAARFRARKMVRAGDFSTWLRDDSSRA